MRISGIYPSYTIRTNYNNVFKGNNVKTENANYVSTRGMNGEQLIMHGEASKHFTLKENLSNEKVGSKFILEAKDPKYQGLKLLITPETVIQSDKMKIAVKKYDLPSFKGRLYGTIRQDDQVDTNMQNQYIRYWSLGMHDEIQRKYLDKKYAPLIKQDYNLVIPSDGDGKRYKDVTTLQGRVTKPASFIPAELNGENMSLAQNVIANFDKTGKLDQMYDFIRVKPAQGSAYGFLEGLRNGQIPEDMPLVFSWGDNFTDVHIPKLLYEHEKSNSAFTITTIPVEKQKTKSLSVVKIDSLENKSIKEFTEKPQDDNYINSCVVPELGKNKCLAAVGPYVLSAPVVKWIKDKYTENPESFKDPDKGYDFSSKVIAPVLEAINNGEIKDKDGNTIDMKMNIISDKETWSDLGSQKDFSAAMKDIKKGKYINMPKEMLSTIKQNVDDNNNITFNTKTRKMFDSLVSDLNLNAKNVIAYCKD